MKKFTFLFVILTLLNGCVTRKIPVMPEATSVTSISETSASYQGCETIDVYVLEDAHPNNVVPVLKNEAYLAGANRYSISEVVETRRGRPSSVVAQFYSCESAHRSTSDATMKLLPGAQSVSPVAFSEVENTSCKILTTKTFEETSQEQLEIDIANEAYMLGGNRFHITKILEVDNGSPTSVVADIYRCKHRTLND